MERKKCLIQDGKSSPSVDDLQRPYAFRSRATQVADVLNRLQETELNFSMIKTLSIKWGIAARVEKELRILDCNVDGDGRRSTLAEVDVRNVEHELTAPEERELLLEYSSIRNVNDDNEKEKVEAQSRKVEIQERFLKAYEPIIRAMAWYYVRQFGLDDSCFDDLSQDGRVQLLIVLDQHNCEKGNRLLKILLSELVNHYYRWIMENGIVKVPIWARGVNDEMLKFIDENPDSTLEEMVAVMSANRVNRVTRLTVYGLLRFCYVDFSYSGDLDIEEFEPSGVDVDACMQVPDDLESLFDGKCANVLIDQFLARKSDVNAELVRRKFGLDSYEEHTLEDLGAMIDRTRERVRMIVKKVLASDLDRNLKDDIRGLLSLYREDYVPLSKEQPVYKL